MHLFPDLLLSLDFVLLFDVLLNLLLLFFLLLDLAHKPIENASLSELVAPSLAEGLTLPKQQAHH